jgi:hypothetical protein
MRDGWMWYVRRSTTFGRVANMWTAMGEPDLAVAAGHDDQPPTLGGLPLPLDRNRRAISPRVGEDLSLMDQ